MVDPREYMKVDSKAVSMDESMADSRVAWMGAKTAVEMAVSTVAL